MKRKYIKPATTVLMVETQNNYCAATSNKTWTAAEFDENDQAHVANPTYDTGGIISDKDDAVHEYNPWDCGTW